MDNEDLNEALRSHRASCEARMVGRTSFANAELQAELRQGPLVNVQLTVDDVGGMGYSIPDGATPYYEIGDGLCIRGRLAGRDNRDWFANLFRAPPPTYPVIVFFAPPSPKAQLSELRPGQTVVVAGYVSGGVTYFSTFIPYFLSRSKLIG